MQMLILECRAKLKFAGVVTPKGDFWSHGLKSYGQVPDDLQGKRVAIERYPQYLPFLIDSKS